MTLTSHAYVRGLIPPRAKACSCFLEKSQTFRAKIRPFPNTKFENILQRHSLEPYKWYEIIKFMVGDFGWEHEGTKSGVCTVKHSWQLVFGHFWSKLGSKDPKPHRRHLLSKRSHQKEIWAQLLGKMIAASPSWQNPTVTKFIWAFKVLEGIHW